MRFLTKLKKDQRGGTTLEYGLTIAFIAAVVIVGIRVLDEPNDGGTIQPVEASAPAAAGE